MTPQDFKNRWINTEGTLFPIKAERLNCFDLLPQTFEFLEIAGLPKYASPELSFVNDSKDIFYGIKNLTEQYGFGNDKSDYEKYSPETKQELTQLYNSLMEDWKKFKKNPYWMVEKLNKKINQV